MKMDKTGQTGQANDAPWFSYTAYIYIFTIIFIDHRSTAGASGCSHRGPPTTHYYVVQHFDYHFIDLLFMLRSTRGCYGYLVVWIYIRVVWGGASRGPLESKGRDGVEKIATEVAKGLGESNTLRRFLRFYKLHEQLSS